MGGPSHRVDQPRSGVGGAVTPGGIGWVSYQREQSAHRASMSDPALPRDDHPGRRAGHLGPVATPFPSRFAPVDRRGLRCVVFAKQRPVAVAKYRSRRRQRDTSRA
ncbi:hypothetical protein XA26_37190 [Mycolicibacterium fortuitum]|uniref:Uncharacterized protein n=1 Tax=Mycolicibacterium fortuitum TaxID=1766 RepID=A0A0N9XL84_MYCFO|nr:hypothetical protein G155_00177 [Mycobacterium sp. VKM Ac-1817D]ALI27540.1 hypothetical protein XA26_37190 [Mycolicibacterium fortuitum]